MFRFLVLGWVVVFCACQPEVQTTETPTEFDAADTAIVVPLSFQTDDIRRTYPPNCTVEGPESGCAQVDMERLVATGGKPGVADRINDSLEVVLKSTVYFPVEGSVNDVTLDEAIFSFLDDFATYRQGAEVLQSWTSETTSEILYEDDDLVTLQTQNYSYTGGAHPNSYVDIRTFSKADGKQLTYADLYPDENIFQQRAEAGFRDARREVLAGGQTLFEAGFFWEGEFTLPANFGVVGDSILLYYNPYEVAAYVYGPTTYKVAR